MRQAHHDLTYNEISVLLSEAINKRSLVVKLIPLEHESTCGGSRLTPALQY
jgi:hypothetical protein